MIKTVLGLLALLPFVSAAQTWETDIGQGIINLAGNAVCTNAFYTGESCGMFIVGLLAFLIFVYYCFAVGLSSEVIVPIGGLLLISLVNFTVLPIYLGFAAAIIAGLFLFKAGSQIPNG